MPTQREIDIATAIRLRKRKQEEIGSFFEDPNEVSVLDQRVATAMNPREFKPKIDTTPIYMQPMAMDVDSSSTAETLTAESVPRRTLPMTQMLTDIRGNPQEQGTFENIARGAGSFAAMFNPIVGLGALVEAGVEAKNPVKPVEDMVGGIVDTYQRQVTGEANGMSRRDAWLTQPVEETLNLAAPVLAFLPFAKGLVKGKGSKLANVPPEVIAEEVSKMGFDVASIEKPAVKARVMTALEKKLSKDVDAISSDPLMQEMSPTDLTIGKSKNTTALQDELAKSNIKPQTPQTISEGVAQEFDPKKMQEGFDRRRREWIDNERKTNPNFAPDIESAKELLTPEQLSEVNRYEELMYKSVAHDKKYKPMRLSKAEQSEYRTLHDKYKDLFYEPQRAGKISTEPAKPQTPQAISEDLSQGNTQLVKEYADALGQDIKPFHEKFVNAVMSKDADYVSRVIAQAEGSNKISRAFFVKHTGVKLPTTISGKKQAIYEWAGKEQPAQIVKPEPTPKLSKEEVFSRFQDAQRKGKINSALSKSIKHNGKLMSKREYIEELYRNGGLSEAKPKQVFNQRTSSFEYDNSKMEYRITLGDRKDGTFHTVSKTEYDYFNELQRAGKISTEPPKVTPDAGATPAQSIELGAFGTPDVARATAESIAKGAEWALEKFHTSQLQAWSRLFTSAEERLKSPASKELISEMRTAMGIKMRLVGQASESLIESRFQKLKANEAENLSRIMRGEKVAPVSQRVADLVPVVKGLMEAVHNTAVKSGMDIGKIQKDYFPNIIKHDVAVKLREDINGFIKEAETILKNEQAANPNAPLVASDKALLDVFKRMEYLRKDLNPETVEIIQEGIKNGKSFPETMLELRSYANDDPVMPFGNLEKHRTLSIPSKYFETDAKVILGKYLNGWADRVSQTAQWGNQNRRVTELLMKIQQEAPQEYTTASKMFDYYIGKHAPEEYLSKGTAKLVGNVQGGVVSTLGAGFSTLLNMFQFGISVLPKAGVVRTVKAMGQIGKGVYESKISGQYSNYLRTLRETGAPYTANALEMLGGSIDGATFGEKLASKSLKISGFTGINKINQYVAAGVGKGLLDDLIPLAKGKSIRAKWAQKTLKEDFKIDYAQPISTNQKLEAIGRWANDSQLQKNIMRDPLWMNDPKLKFMATFKKFIYRQGQYSLKDIIIKEIKRGNALPTLRLISSGVIGGEAAIWAQNKVREFMSGDPHYRKEDWSDWERYANDLAAVGTLGAFTEVFKLNSTLPEDQIIEGAETAMKLFSPVLLEKIYGSTVGSPGGKDVGGAIGTLKEGVTKGWGAGVKELLEEASSQFGALPAALGRRAKNTDFSLQTFPVAPYMAIKGKKNEEKTLEAYKKKRSDETKNIAYLFYKNKDKEAERRIELWEQNYPDLPIEPDQLEAYMLKFYEKEDGEE